MSNRTVGSMTPRAIAAALVSAVVISGTSRSSVPPPMESRLYVMDADGQNVREVTRDKGLNGLNRHSWSPDGRRLLLEGITRDVGDCGVAAGDRRSLTDEPEFDGRAAYSPDGRHIAFDSQRGGNFDIYVMRSDGTQLRRLTTDPAFDYSPRWSPDGQRLAFQSRRQGQPALFVMKPDGSGQKLVAERTGDHHFDWSPDGRQLVFSRMDLYRVNVDGTGELRLTRDHRPIAPSWHRNGRILFTALIRPEPGAEPRPRICTVRADGTDLLTLSLTGHGPVWSPDGRQIAFQRDTEVWKMKADGTGQVQLTRGPKLFARPAAEDPGPFPPGLRGWPSWSPDGKKIAFLAEDWETTFK
jgi:Tol biopolymer transport system component